MNILVVDGDPMFRNGVVTLLQQQDDFEMVEKEEQGQRAIERLQEIAPDVMLIDVNLPGTNGLEVARQAKEMLPGIKIILTTAAQTDQEFWETIQVGANGYLSKHIEPEALYRSIRGVTHGEAAIPRCFVSKLLEKYAELNKMVFGGGCMAKRLSPREEDILELLKTGTSNKEIASCLGISENTVKTHLKRIMTKLNLDNRTQAGIYALGLWSTF